MNDDVMKKGLEKTCEKLSELGWECENFPSDRKRVSRIIIHRETGKKHIVIIRTLSDKRSAILTPSDLKEPYEFLILCVSPEEDTSYYIMEREEILGINYVKKMVDSKEDTIWVDFPEYRIHKDRWDKLLGE